MNRKLARCARTTCVRLDLLLLFLCGLSLVLATGCDGGSGKTASPTIAFATGEMAPPSSVMASSSAQFAAVVSDDQAQRGVSWMLTCNSDKATDCGSIGRHTASGVPTTYIAPVSAPPGGTVTIVANSSSAPDQSVTVVMQITPIVYGPVSIAFSPVPVSSMLTGTQAIFSAVVTNDHLDGQGNPMGYTVKVTCAIAGTCGGLNGATYTAPAAVPSGGTVTITATSTADTTQSVSTTVTITPAPVVLSLVPPPMTTLSLGAAVNLSAMVTGDPAALGVDWSIACNGGACGSLIPAHTASKVVTSYAAPSVVPSGGAVTVTATSTADPTKQASATFTITPATLRNDLLTGPYAFLLNGVNLTFPTALAGSLVADGNGNITSAEESVPGQTAVLTGISGTYYIGEDGRGIMTLSGLPSYTSWLNGQQVFAITVIDPTHAFIEEFDGVGTYAYESGAGSWKIDSHGGTMRGTLDLQAPDQINVAPSGPYAFAWSTTSTSAYYAAYYGGVVDVDPTGNITSFAMDRYIGDTTGSIVSGTYGIQSFDVPDNFGHGTVRIGPYSLHYFLVDSEHIIILGSSTSDSTGFPAGHMYARPQAPASLDGTYVFTLAGSTPIYAGNGKAAGSFPQAIGGWFACGPGGILNGHMDTNNNRIVQSAQVSGTFAPSGGCATELGGRGVLTLTGAGASKFAVYPTSHHGLLLFQLDSRKSGIGTALPQTSPSAIFQGNYAVSAQQMGDLDSTRAASAGMYVGAWSNLTGQLLVDGSSNLTGALDVDQLSGQFVGLGGDFWMQFRNTPLTGSFTSGLQGRFTGSITTNQLMTPDTTGTKSMVFYVVDDSTVMFLEDDNTVALGILQLQNF